MSQIRGEQITGSVASASYAVTASYALNGGGGGSGAGFPYVGNAVITGSLTVSGSGTPITTYNRINILPSSTYNTSSIRLGTMTIEHSDNDYSMALGVDNKPVGTGLSALYGLALGYQAGSGSLNASNTIHIGYQAGIQSTGDNSVFLGSGAGQFSTGDQFIAIGQGAGGSNTGTSVIAIGNTAAASNTKSNVVCIGDSAGVVNNGSNVVAIGTTAGVGNSGNNAIMIGNGAGYIQAVASNTYSNVILLGFQALASANNQLAFTRSGSGFSYNAQFDANNITADRKYTLPNSSSILPLSVNGTGSNSTGNITLTNITSASYATTASFAVTYLTATSVTTAATASFVTSSNVYGPFGSDSITSASYALTASYALNGGGGGGGTLSYGSFYTAKTTPLPSSPVQMDLDAVDVASGISSGPNSIAIVTTGIYNFQISVTVTDQNGGNDLAFYLYDSTSTTLLPTSAKTMTRVMGANDVRLISWSCLVSLSSGADIQIYGGSSTNSGVSTATPSNGGYPLVISVIKVA